MKSTLWMKNNFIWIGGLVSMAVFALLLAIRMDIFTPGQSSGSLMSAEKADREVWMNIYRKDQKIGFTHRRLSHAPEGFRLIDSTDLKLNVMGMVQDIRIRTTAFLNDDFSLSSFTFNLGSGLFDLSASGTIKEKSLLVSINGHETEIPLKDPVYLLTGIFDTALVRSLTYGETATFDVFDPSTMSNMPVRVTLEGDYAVTIQGDTLDTVRYGVEYMGLNQKTWLDENGDIVQETGAMGIRLVRSSRQNAAQGLSEGSTDDLTESFSIISNKTIENPANLKQLVLKVSGTGDFFFLDGGRQTLHDGRLTITRESQPQVDNDKTSRAADEQDDFLSAAPTIESDHPKIRNLAVQIAPPGTPPLTAARNIMTWIYENIEKRPVISIPDALQTLENRMGDCNEHAVLFAALARAAGIPAQIEAGLVYMDGRFYYHAWNVVLIKNWLTVDAALGQMPADVTHIRLVRGSEMNQLDLVHAVDALQLDILEMQ